MATQRRLSRPQERYVPQQESYRNLPKPSSAARPVDVQKDAAAGGGAKAKEMAEALAIGNKAIADFLKMEKSYEETNRLANEVRGRLNLPPIDGQGMFGYGADAGYLRGRGKADAVQKIQELETSGELYQGITPGMTDAQVSSMVQDRVNKGLMDLLANAEGNPEYLEGAASDLAKFKVETVVNATNILLAQKQQQRLNDAFAVTGKFYDDVGLNGLNQQQFVGNARAKANELMLAVGLDRTTANAIVVETGVQRYSADYEKAKLEEDPDGMANAMAGMRNLKKLMNSKDNSGIIFGGHIKNKDGSVSRNLKVEYGELTDALGKMTADYLKVTKDSIELLKHSKMADVYRRISSGEDPLLVQQSILDDTFMSRNPETFIDVVAYLDKAVDAPLTNPGSSRVLAGMLLSGKNFSNEGITQAFNAGLLTTGDALKARTALLQKQKDAIYFNSYATNETRRKESDVERQRVDGLTGELLREFTGLSADKVRNAAKYSSTKEEAHALLTTWAEDAKEKAFSSRRPATEMTWDIMATEARLPSTVVKQIGSAYDAADEGARKEVVDFFNSVDWRNYNIQVEQKGIEAIYVKAKMAYCLGLKLGLPRAELNKLQGAVDSAEKQLERQQQ
jgi:hypothetical protein